MKASFVWILLTPFTFGFFLNSPAFRAVPTSWKILILPGFGNDSIDYTDEGRAGIEGSLVSSLKSRGWKEEQIDILPVKRTDWLQVFWKGVFDVKFWQAEMPPSNPAFRWYLERIREKVQQTEEGERLILVAHSAGGWLARAALGFGSCSEELYLDLSKIAGLVTLGAPNRPPPPSVMDMTRGALKITDQQFPGAFHAPSLFYITVVGNAVQGVKQERTSPLEPTKITGFAYNSYEAVCGDGAVTGDGVVPLCAAHLDNALQLTLDNVFHSINAPCDWYGSNKVLDRWHQKMLDQIDRSVPGKASKPLAKTFQ